MNVLLIKIEFAPTDSSKNTRSNISVLFVSEANDYRAIFSSLTINLTGIYNSITTNAAKMEPTNGAFLPHTDIFRVSGYFS